MAPAATVATKKTKQDARNTGPASNTQLITAAITVAMTMHALHVTARFIVSQPSAWAAIRGGATAGAAGRSAVTAASSA